MPDAPLNNQMTPPVYGNKVYTSDFKDIEGVLVRSGYDALEITLGPKAQQRLQSGWQVLLGAEAFLTLCIAVTLMRYPSGSENGAMFPWLLVAGYLAVTVPLTVYSIRKIQTAKTATNVVFSDGWLSINGSRVCPYDEVRAIHLVQDKDSPLNASSITAVAQDGRRIPILPSALGFGAGYPTEVAEIASAFTGIQITREMRDFSPS